jgi:hypothetical protein
MSTTALTADGLALEIILSPRSAAVRKSALKSLAARVEHTAECCHECGSREHTDNGAPATSSEFTLRCLDCGEQWCPNA